MGVLVTIGREGQLEATVATGLRDVASPYEVDHATSIAIGSLTKLVTALGVLRLHARGVVDLDDPANRYLRGVKLTSKGSGEITLRELLTHTSGLEAGRGLRHDPTTPVQLVDEASQAQARLELPPTIRRVGVVVPVSSAGIADFHGALGATAAVLVEEHRCRMAGPAAGADIARAILLASRRDDVVIAVRGGGAAGDLAAWDSPDVVEAIGACPVPAIVAIGHTRDRHRADDAAWLSLPTPTSAGGWLRTLVERPGRMV